MNLYGERAVMYDLLQRLYTDDGHGSGRLVNIHAMRLLEASNRSNQPMYLPSLAGPITSQLMAGRAEMRRAYDDAIEIAAQCAKLPLSEQSGAWGLAMQRLEDPVWRERHLLASILLPALGRANLSFAMAASQREATVAAIALERYRLAHNTYPATLAELVPAYLPAIPLDPWDGMPIKYLPPDASRPTPVLYSIGENQIDNLGDGKFVPVPPSPGRRRNEVMYNDQILWPPPIITAPFALPPHLGIGIPPLPGP